MAKVTVFGSYIMDLTCYAPHIPVVGETVFAGPFLMGPGGKGFNQAVAAKQAGADVNFIGMVGDDAFCTFAKNAFDQFGISKEYLFETEGATGAALITVETEKGDNSIAVATGACQSLTRKHVRQAKKAFEGRDVFLTQLECDLEATYEAIETASNLGSTVILNTAPYREIDPDILQFVDIIMLNETECAQLTGRDISDHQSLMEAAAKLSESVDMVIITLGANGVYCPKVCEEVIPIHRTNTIDTTGAGDAFAGVFAAYLADGKSLQESITFAKVGAALSTTKKGTAPSMPLQADIEAAL